MPWAQDAQERLTLYLFALLKVASCFTSIVTQMSVIPGGGAQL